ncbi:tryptophan dimethylallyltransferase [Nannizzia gypsea CBS 118893]|uniref:Tryptophan dimethylallyltransferase n=1 Tax=Arthroderma gypseum (strain ATCC MYA-4604 / CBS 118893) TaxID=535722 RepID=E4V752_ARTGP|nr:tryptophan dimethylallyltransferase [Nannizzia gypsea CBS 118893]EFQ96918.1 tryptophan dimethylallyltransferase [Nannizzia gypsea CBS 118893]
MAISTESLISAPVEVKTQVNGSQNATVHKIANGDHEGSEPMWANSSAPYDVLTVALPLPAPASSTGYWWRTTGPLMSKLLEKAEYSLYKHYKYLLLYHTHILPLLGPRPIEDPAQALSSIPPWKSFLTDDFSPLEPSWNVSGNSDSRSIIRLGIEPVSFDAGTAIDPFNQISVARFFESQNAAEVGVKGGLFEHFRNDLFVGPESYMAIREMLPEGEHMTQSFLAFDLDSGHITTKAYFFPILKALSTQQSTIKVLSDSIMGLAKKSNVWGPQAIVALAILEAWIASYNGGAKAEMLSVDCVDDAESRIKIYVRIPHTALRKVKEAYCLGGRLTDDNTAQSLDLLDTAWRTMFRVTDDAAELPHNSHRTAGTIFNFEIRPGKWFPEPKVYLPVRHYCDNDLQIASRLQELFGRLGWQKMERNYRRDFADLFPHHPLSTSTGTHTYLAFSYKKQKGVYMTMYYSPRVYSTQAGITDCI